MKIGKKSRKLIDQVFLKGRGWIHFKAIPLRWLWRAHQQRKYRDAEAVHFVEHGDYLISEL